MQKDLKHTVRPYLASLAFLAHPLLWLGMAFVVGIGLISWLDMARIARGQTLSLKNKEFVEVAHATGVSPWKIVIKHIVPNLLGIVIVYAMPETAKRAAIADIDAALSDDRLRHRVAARFPLDDIAAAHERIEAGVRGCGVVTVR